MQCAIESAYELICFMAWLSMPRKKLSFGKQNFAAEIWFAKRFSCSAHHMQRRLKLKEILANELRLSGRVRAFS